DDGSVSTIRNKVALLLPDGVQVKEILFSRSNTQTDVHRHIETGAPLLGIDFDPFVSQTNNRLLVLMLQQKLVDMQEQRLDTRLREDASDGLDLHSGNIRGLR